MTRSMLKTLLTSILALASLAGPLAAGQAHGNLRYTITVKKFENRSGLAGNWDLGNAWATHLTAALQENGSFIVLGESDMRKAAMDEQAFATTGATAQGDKTPVHGQLTPAQLLVKGVITQYNVDSKGQDGTVGVKGFRIGAAREKAEIHATLYLVDTTTGQVLAGKNFVGTAQKRKLRFGFNHHGADGNVGSNEDLNTVAAIENAIDQVIPWLVQQLPSVIWRGSVVLVKGDDVYINRGSREGVQKGETFVVGKAKVLRDPATGEVLDQTVNEVARVRADRVKEKITICSVIHGDPTLVYKGMGIERPTGM